MRFNYSIKRLVNARFKPSLLIVLLLFVGDCCDVHDFNSKIICTGNGHRILSEETG